MNKLRIQNTYIEKKNPIKFSKQIILYEMCLSQDESKLICVTENKIISIEIKDQEQKMTTVKMKFFISTIRIHHCYTLLVEDYCKLRLFKIQQDYSIFQPLEYQSSINPLTIPSFHKKQNLVCFCYQNKFLVYHYIKNTKQNSIRCKGQAKMCQFLEDDFLLGVEQNFIQTIHFYSLKTNKIYKSLSLGYSIMNRCQIVSQILFFSSSNQLQVYNIQTCKLLFRKSFQQQQISQCIGQQLMKIYSLNDCSLEISSFNSRKINRVIFLKNPKGFKVSQNEKIIYVMNRRSIHRWELSE